MCVVIMEYYKIIGSLIGSGVTWVLVIAGWLVVSDQQDDRELRKNRSVRIDEIRCRLAALEEAAVTFHTTLFDHEKLFILKRRLGVLSNELALLKNCEFVHADCSIFVMRFRQACTADNVEPSTHEVQSVTSPLVGAIMAARDDLDLMLVRSLTLALTRHKSVLSSLRNGGAKLFG